MLFPMRTFGKIAAWMMFLFPFTTSAQTDYCSQLNCEYGFVWREAFYGDKVCVTGAMRAAVDNDNVARASRWNRPRGGAYGPDTCRPGYVWREASPNDHVCVSREMRQQVALDNSMAQQRIEEVCRPGRCNRLTPEQGAKCPSGFYCGSTAGPRGGGTTNICLRRR